MALDLHCAFLWCTQQNKRQWKNIHSFMIMMVIALCGPGAHATKLHTIKLLMYKGLEKKQSNKISFTWQRCWNWPNIEYSTVNGPFQWVEGRPRWRLNGWVKLMLESFQVPTCRALPYVFILILRLIPKMSQEISLYPMYSFEKCKWMLYFKGWHYDDDLLTFVARFAMSFCVVCIITYYVTLRIFMNILKINLHYAVTS